MKRDEFCNRLKEILRVRNMKQIELSNISKIDKSLINKYIKGIAEPGGDNLYSLAKALNVSEAWLMGFNVPMDGETEMITSEQFNDDVVQMTADKVMYFLRNITSLEKKAELLDKIAWELEKRSKNLK